MQKKKSCLPYGPRFMQKDYCKLCSLNENDGVDYSILNPRSVLLMREWLRYSIKVNLPKCYVGA